MTDIIFCGNPGVGKSTLLTSISDVQFQSGFNWAQGLTNQLNFKENPNIPGYRFGDTPGLADVAIAERAAEAITEALREAARQGRRVLIFFIVTVESGRVKPDDLFTIKQVMGSITFPNGQRPSRNDYGVIINKCTFMDRPDFGTNGRKMFDITFGTQSTAVPYTTEYIHFVPHIAAMVDVTNCRHQFNGLKEWVMQYPGINISSVSTIDVSGLAEHMRQAEEQHKREMEQLQEKLRKEAEVWFFICNPPSP